MPTYALFEQENKEGYKPADGYHIKHFTAEEAQEYGQLMKDTFVKFWEGFQK